MNARSSPLLATLVAALALAGCAGLHRAGPDRSHDGAPLPLADLGAGRGNSTERRPLPSAAGQSPKGCAIDTTQFTPGRPRTRVPVILAHGFLRDQRYLAGLARALAGHGIPAVTLNVCNSRPWDARPVRNALDMIAIARRLDAPAVVYAGFSAGGLAALIAGRLDPHTLGVLTLDLVDNQGLGVGMARSLDPPLRGLAGSPTACNAHNNGLRVFAVAPRARVSRIPGASHCDFESPTDWLCESVCGSSGGGPPARRQVIIDAAVAAVSDLIGLAPRDSSRLPPSAATPDIGTIHQRIDAPTHQHERRAAPRRPTPTNEENAAP